MSQRHAPGQIVTPDELRAVAADGTKLRYALMELAGQIPDAITLGRGDPDLDTPAHVIAAAQEAVRDGRADLPAPVEGLAELRAAVAHNLQINNGIPAQPDDVLITGGGQEEDEQLSLLVVFDHTVDDDFVVFVFDEIVALDLEPVRAPVVLVDGA